MTVRPNTSVVVFSPLALPRAAWCALLCQQAQLTVQCAVGEFAQLPAPQTDGAPVAILVDLPAPSAILLQELAASLPTAGLLALVESYALEEIMPLIQVGVTGCLTRNDTVADLARALIAVGRGEVALPPSVAGRALALLARGTPVPGALVEPLSDRETEVLRLLAAGLTNKDIAQSLILSVRTVEAHLRNIFGKLGVRSRTEAALWAVRHDVPEIGQPLAQAEPRARNRA